MTHGLPIVGTTGPAAPTSTLTICAPDNLCGARSFYNDCPIGFGYEYPFDELIYLPAVETHLRQVPQSVGGCHDALACFGALGVGILR
jgi:hypothetical protein